MKTDDRIDAVTGSLVPRPGEQSSPVEQPAPTDSAGPEVPRPGDQPLPTESDGPDVWAEIIDDMRRRRQTGLLRYGQPLRPDNGRDALRDLYEELLDALAYVMQTRLERDALREEAAALRRQIAALRRQIAAASEVLSRLASRRERVRVMYRNHRGEVALRTVAVLAVRFGTAPPWHEDPQPLLVVFDYDRDAPRTLALGRVVSWAAAGEVAT